jgi:hypothetical protein
LFSYRPDPGEELSPVSHGVTFSDEIPNNLPHQLMSFVGHVRIPGKLTRISPVGLTVQGLRLTGSVNVATGVLQVSARSLTAATQPVGAD